MKISKILSKLKVKYNSFKTNPLTKTNPILALMKYGILNYRLHVLKSEVLITFLDDIKCLVKKGDGISGNYFYKLYEYQDSLFVLHYLKPGDVFYDIGANVGHFSLLTSKIIDVKTTAVEPIPNTYKRLLSNVELNKNTNIKALNIGLSDKPGELYFTTGLYTTNRVSSKNDPSAIKVEVKTLNEISNGEPVSLMKIDVEGYEKFVLEGGDSVLKSDSLQAIIIELNESGKTFNVKDSEIIDLLNTYKFKPYSCHPFTRSFKKLSSNNKSGFNTIFIKDLERVSNRVLNSKAIKVGKKSI